MAAECFEASPAWSALNKSLEDGGKTGLLSLPAELIELIAERLPLSSDLLALRSICRDIESHTRRTFAQANFQAKAFLLCDRQSMQALVDIARHPVFGKLLRSITLAAWRVLDSEDDYHARDEHYTRSRLNAQGRDMWLDFRERRVAHARVLEDHQRYWDSRHWLSQISDALRTLAESGQSLQQLAFAWRNGAACGSKRLENVLGYPGCLAQVETTATSMVHGAETLAAILASDCQIARLDLETQLMSFGDLPLGQRLSHTRRHAGTTLASAIDGSKILNGLHSLDLFGGCPSSGYLRNHSDTCLADFLAKMPNLERLSIKTCPCSAPEGLIQKFLRHAFMPNLLLLDLSSSRVECTDLFRFIKPHAGVLQTVRVQELIPPPNYQVSSDRVAAVAYAVLLQDGLRLDSFLINDQEYATDPPQVAVGLLREDVFQCPTPPLTSLDPRVQHNFRASTMGNRHSTVGPAAPPPYSPLPANDASGLQKDQMQEFVALTSGIVDRERSGILDRERSGGISDCLRLQNFLRFLLLVDYNTLVEDEELTPADYNHFTKLYVLTKDMPGLSGARANLRGPEKEVSAEYLYRNLYQPSGQLGLPYDIVLKMVYRFGTSRDSAGKYKGCTSSVLQNSGLHEFATKLLVDSKIMVPLLFDKGGLRAALEDDLRFELYYRGRRGGSRWEKAATSAEKVLKEKYSSYLSEAKKRSKEGLLDRVRRPLR
ncbi:hypothetical protein LTR17_021183 [Elasticomyces elasticus]|nr:hypothetical protein LTR17_021183 [Elasticomyces elasticus]